MKAIKMIALAALLPLAAQADTITAEYCDGGIQTERRKADPWATRCVYCQEASEVGRR